MFESPLVGVSCTQWATIPQASNHGMLRMFEPRRSTAWFIRKKMLGVYALGEAGAQNVALIISLHPIPLINRNPGLDFGSIHAHGQVACSHYFRVAKKDAHAHHVPHLLQILAFQ